MGKINMRLLVWSLDHQSWTHWPEVIKTRRVVDWPGISQSVFCYIQHICLWKESEVTSLKTNWRYFSQQYFTPHSTHCTNWHKNATSMTSFSWAFWHMLPLLQLLRQQLTSRPFVSFSKTNNSSPVLYLPLLSQREQDNIISSVNVER